MTRASDLATAASRSRLSNGSVQHGSLRFHVPCYLQGVVEAVEDVGIENNLAGSTARFSQQTLTMHLGLSGLSRFLNHHQIQLSSMWEFSDCSSLYLSV